MAYDPTAYARKKAEAKEKADKLKIDRDARKGELEAQAAERKAAMDALKTTAKPPSATTSSSTPSTPTPAPRIPAPAPSRPTSSSNTGGDNTELLNRIQSLEAEVQTLKEKDQSRQRDFENLSKQFAKLEVELRNRSSGEEKAKPTAPTISSPKPSIPAPSPKPTPKPETAPPAAIPKLATPKPKAPAPAPPGGPSVESQKPAPKAAPLPEPVGREEEGEVEEVPEDLDELPVGGGGSGPSEFPDDAQDVGELVTCTGCDRKFNSKAMKTHAKICKKVFQTKRKAFKMEFIDPEQMDDFRPPPKKDVKKTEKKEDDKEKVPKWKQQTDQLRAALKAGRDMQKALAEGVALKDIPVAAVPAQADDRVTCPHCGRKFAEATAERHMPACKISKATKKK